MTERDNAKLQAALQRLVSMLGKNTSIIMFAFNKLQAVAISPDAVEAMLSFWKREREEVTYWGRTTDGQDKYVKVSWDGYLIMDDTDRNPFKACDPH